MDNLRFRDRISHPNIGKYSMNVNILNMKLERRQEYEKAFHKDYERLVVKCFAPPLVPHLRENQGTSD